jgi:hypothetical protein
MRAARCTEEMRNGQKEKTIRYEGMASPRELLERIVIQCEQALKTLGSAKAQSATEKEKIEAKSIIGQLLVEEKGKVVSSENETEALRRFW